MIREVNQNETFIETARDLSEEILRDSVDNCPLALHVLGTFGPVLQAAPFRKSIPISGSLWSIPGVAIKFDALRQGMDLDLLAMLTVRFMMFDGGYWGKEQSEKYSFLMTPDGSFASVRRQAVAPGLDQAGNLRHTIDLALDNIKQAPTVAGMPPKAARWTQRYIHPLTGKVILVCFTPVYDNSGRLVLYIGTDVDPNHILSNKRSAALPSGEAVQLIDKEGNVIAWKGDALLDGRSKPAGFSMPFFGISAVIVDPTAGTISFDRHIRSLKWRVVYSVKLQKIFWPQVSLLVLLGMLLCLYVIAVFFDNRFIRRHVIAPARRRLAALRDSAEFAHAVLSMAPVGLAVIEPSGPSLQASNPIYDQGVDLIKTFGAAGLAQLQCQLSAPFSERVITQTVQQTLGGQDERFYSITAALQTLREKSALIFAVSDITTQKRSEAELLLARDTIALASHAKDALLATVSHEIRTPLYGALASLELLAGTPLNDPQHYYIDVMQSSTRNLLELINDLLDFSRIEAGKLSLATRPVCLIAELEQAGRGFATRARLQGLTFDWMIDPALARTVITDPVRLTQVVTNLVGNAIKFTSAGYISVSARLDACSDTHCKAVLVVSDSGIGIAATQIGKLFEPFAQIERAAADSSGTGLGLSISRKLAALLGGEIRVESRQGMGATFTVTLNLPWAEPALPLAPPRGYYVYATAIGRRAWYLRALIQQAGFTPLAYSEHDSVCSSASGMLAFADEQGGAERVADCDAESFQRIVLVDANAPEPEDAAAPSPCMHFSAFRQALIVDGIKNGNSPLPSGGNRSGRAASGKRWHQLYVLVVDDHLINGTILAHQLETLGCMVDLYNDPLEAQEAFDPDSHQLVLTDVNMPGMSGAHFANRVKAIAAAMPVVAITADARLDTAHDRPRVFDLVLTKPLTAAQLDSAIQALVADGLLQAGDFDADNPSPSPAMEPRQLDHSLRKRMVAIMDLDLAHCASAASSQELDQTAQLAHRMRGAFLACGCRSIAALCADIEAAANSGSIDSLPILLQKINEEWRKVRASLLASSDGV